MESEYDNDGWTSDEDRQCGDVVSPGKVRVTMMTPPGKTGGAKGWKKFDDSPERVQSLGGGKTSPLRVTFRGKLADGVAFSWNTLLVSGHTLFVEIPDLILPHGSRDSLVSLLDYAEERLKCKEVIVCFRKTRPDMPSLTKLFMFLGFKLLGPTNKLIPASSRGDILYMSYDVACSLDDTSGGFNDAGSSTGSESD